MSSLVLLLAIGMAVSLLFTDGEAAPSVEQVHPEMWPMAKSPVGLDATIEKRITEMLSQMSIEEKIGQVIQLGERARTLMYVGRSLSTLSRRRSDADRRCRDRVFWLVVHFHQGEALEAERTRSPVCAEDLLAGRLADLHSEGILDRG